MTTIVLILALYFVAWLVGVDELIERAGIALREGWLARLGSAQNKHRGGSE